MQKHIKVYLKTRGYEGWDHISCEVCQKTAVDIHHREGRREKDSDRPDNLIALCRECHSNQLILNAIKAGYNLHHYNKYV